MMKLYFVLEYPDIFHIYPNMFPPFNDHDDPAMRPGLAHGLGILIWSSRKPNSSPSLKPSDLS